MKILFRRTANQIPTKFPSSLSAVAVGKTCHVLFACACGRFILFTHYVSVDDVPTSLTVQPSLHYAQFISPTSAPHSISGSVTPCHKIHAVIPFRSTVAYPPTLKTLQTLQDLQPSTDQLNSIPFPQRLVSFRSLTTYALFQRFLPPLLQERGQG